MEDFAEFAAFWQDSNPYKIPRGSVTVDGDLSDWPEDLQWIKLDTTYDGQPQDIDSGRFCLLWDTEPNRIYAAVVINDTDHVFTDDYTSWDASDRIEVYCQGTAAGGTDYAPDYAVAQHYYIAPGLSADSWAAWAIPGAPVEHSVGLEKAVTVDGDQIIYELAIPVFDYFGGLTGESTTVTDMREGIQIGFDITALTRTSEGGYGMLSDNSMPLKFNDAGNFARYRLVNDISDVYGDQPKYDFDSNNILDLNDLLILVDGWLCTEP